MNRILIAGAAATVNAVAWDVNICHTCYILGWQDGNLPLKWSGEPNNIWDGDNPPNWQAPPPGPPIAFICP